MHCKFILILPARFCECSILVSLLDTAPSMLFLCSLPAFTQRFNPSCSSLPLRRGFATFLVQWGTAPWQCSRSIAVNTIMVSILASSSPQNVGWLESTSPYFDCYDWRMYFWQLFTPRSLKTFMYLTLSVKYWWILTFGSGHLSCAVHYMHLCKSFLV